MLMTMALDLRTEAYDDRGERMDPIAVPAVIPAIHDCPGYVPPSCVHCREPIRGIPARTGDNRTYHTACLIRMRTR